MSDEQVPQWFWKMMALCLAGMTGTLILTGWQVGDYVGESRMWNQAQDRRLQQHVEEEKAQTKAVIDYLQSLDKGISANGRYGAAFKARMDAIDKRLDRLEAKTD